MVKAQIPLNGYGRDALILFKFVWRQSGFAFFGALTSVGALFYISKEKGKLKMILSSAPTAAAQASGGTGNSIVILCVIWAIWVIIGLSIYFIPSFIAMKKHHVQKTSILILNIFLGWTFLGWVIALIWATLKDKNTNRNNLE